MNLEPIRKALHSGLTRTLSTEETPYSAFDRVFQKAIFGSSNVSVLATEILQQRLEVNPRFKFPYWLLVISASKVA